MSYYDTVEMLTAFLHRRNYRGRLALPAMSLYSGAGLSDIGYELAGFKFHVQCELDPSRAELGKRNFPDSQWIVGDVQEKCDEIVSAYHERAPNVRPSLLVLTPPCQGMSSSNPGRGKVTDPKESDHRNTLLLEALPVVKALRPRVVVAENVAPLLNRVVEWQRRVTTLAKAFADGMTGYRLFAGVVEMADYGIPQRRKRAFLVAIQKDEPILERLEANKLLPWPRPTHSEQAMLERGRWVTIKEWLEQMNYPPLDACTNPTNPNLPLHFVPEYPQGDRRYMWVSDIPPYSGQNAYANSTCPSCKRNSVPEGIARCPHCDSVLLNRPTTQNKNGTWRLIKGFKSSYRRAAPDEPAPTVTTNSSHLGSDNKIHPWEHRVLSALECADLQTVPRFYDWKWALETNHRYVIRNAIGEALPAYFTYLHGQVLVKLLAGILPESKLSRVGVDRQERAFDVA